MINLEIKIRVDDLAPYVARATAARAVFSGTLRQVDTYFEAARGLLKLRVVDSETGCTAELIAYDRPTVEGSRVSDYTVCPVDNPDLLLETLSKSLERGVRIRKSRDLWMFGGTRIHFDTVEDLGTFIELETEGNTRSADAMTAEHDAVIELLELDRGAAIAGSYAQMMAGRKPPDGP